MSIPMEKKGRRLVWHDEFDGNAIDYDKWCFRRTMGYPDRDFDNSERCIRVEDGNAHLQVWKSDKEGCTYALSEGFTTCNTMNFKYGYLEMRAKVPYRKGAWPSFWMQASPHFRQCAAWMCETDIFEVFSSDRWLGSCLHKWGKDGKYAMLDINKVPRVYTFQNYENLNDEYHVYGFEWDPQEMKFYVDDECFATFPITVEGGGDFGHDVLPGVEGFHDFQFIIINNEIYTVNNWKDPGPDQLKIALNDADVMPIDYYIDYMRLYQRDGEEIKLKPEIDAVIASKA